MVIHIANVGTSSKNIVLGFKNFKDIEITKIYLLTGLGKECQEHIDIIKKEYKDKDITVLSHDPFTKDSMNLFLNDIVDIRKKHINDEIHINITGGTNLMGAAALIGAHIIKANAYYILDSEKFKTNQTKVELPVPKLNYIDSITKEKKKILIEISKLSEVKNISKFAKEKIKISKQALTKHIEELKNWGLLEQTSQGRENIVKITKIGKVTVHFLK